MAHARHPLSIKSQPDTAHSIRLWRAPNNENQKTYRLLYDTYNNNIMVKKKKKEQHTIIGATSVLQYQHSFITLIID